MKYVLLASLFTLSMNAFALRDTTDKVKVLKGYNSRIIASKPILFKDGAKALKADVIDGSGSQTKAAGAGKFGGAAHDLHGSSNWRD